MNVVAGIALILGAFYCLVRALTPPANPWHRIVNRDYSGKFLLLGAAIVLLLVAVGLNVPE